MEFDSSFQIWITPNQQLLFPNGGKIKIQIESNLPFLVTDEVIVLTDQNEQLPCQKELQKNTGSILFKDSSTGPRFVTVSVKNLHQATSTSCVYYVYKHKNADQTVQYLQSVIMYQREYVSWSELVFFLQNIWHHKCYKDARKAGPTPTLCDFDWNGIADTLISSKTKVIASLEIISKDEVKAVIKWLNTLADKIQLFPEDFWSFGSNQAREFLTQHLNHAILRFSSEGTFQLCMLTGTVLSQGCVENSDFFISLLSQEMFKNYYFLGLNEACRRLSQNPIGFCSVEVNWVLERLKKVQKSSNYTLFPALNMFWNFNLMSFMPSFLSGYTTAPVTPEPATQKKRRLSDSSEFTVTPNTKITDMMEHVKQQLDLPSELCADIISKFHKEGFMKMLLLQHMSPTDWERLALPLAVQVHLKQLVQQLSEPHIPRPLPPDTINTQPHMPQFSNSVTEMLYDPVIPPANSITTIFSEIFSDSQNE